MHAVALILASTPVPTDPPRRPDGTDPWAIGFAIAIVRNCPGWTMEDQVHLHRKGILPNAGFGSPQWREVEDGIRQGISAAETTRSEQPQMCEDLPALGVGRSERLAPILRRSPKPAPAAR
jgi:hypothetical protein